MIHFGGGVNVADITTTALVHDLNKFLSLILGAWHPYKSEYIIFRFFCQAQSDIFVKIPENSKKTVAFYGNKAIILFHTIIFLVTSIPHWCDVITSIRIVGFRSTI